MYLKKNYFILLIALTVAFVGCEKTEMIELNENSASEKYELPNELLNGVKLNRNVLEFDNMEQISSLIYELDNQTNILIRDFYSQYKDLEEEELITIAESENFNPNIVYETFEKEIGFKSLRSEIKRKELEWLNQEDIKTENDPNNHFIVGEGHRSVLNPDCVIKVGGSLYIVKEDFTIFEITDGNFADIDAVLENSAVSKSNIVLHTKYRSTAVGKDRWIANKGISSTHKTSNKKMKYRLTITNAPWTHYVKATTRAYYKKGLFWRSLTTYLTTDIYGSVWNHENGDDEYGDEYNAGADAGGTGSSQKAKSDFGHRTIKTKPYYLRSTHYASGIGRKTLQLK